MDPLACLRVGAFRMDSQSANSTRRCMLVAVAALACALALPAAAHAQLMSFDGSFGSAIQPGGRFANAQGIATDGAGRVYVADPTAGEFGAAVLRVRIETNDVTVTVASPPGAMAEMPLLQPERLAAPIDL